MFNLNNDSKTLTLVGLILEGLLLFLGALFGLIFGLIFGGMTSSEFSDQSAVPMIVIFVIFGFFYLIGLTFFIINTIVYKKLKSPIPFSTANKLLTYQMVIGIIYLLSNTLVGILYLLSSIFGKRALDEQNLRN
ncbi:MAG: hypothetical protein ACLFRI_07675 [Candidatus Izemoplasmataceae bacterium]